MRSRSASPQRRCSRASCSARVGSSSLAAQAAGAAAARARQGDRAERHRRLRGLVSEPRRHATRCSSATSTETRSRRSTSRSARTTASSPAVRIMGQPTHFLPRRQWGVFVIRVPKDFGKKQADVDARRQRPDHGRSRCTSIRSGSSRRSRMSRSATRRRPQVRRRRATATRARRTGSAGLHGDRSRPLALTVWVTDDGIRATGGARAARDA